MSFPFYDLAWARAVNLTGTDIRASEAEPVLLSGFIVLVEYQGATYRWFVAENVMDFRALPGFVKGTDAQDDAQAPYHEGAAQDFELGREDCT